MQNGNKLTLFYGGDNNKLNTILIERMWSMCNKIGMLKFLLINLGLFLMSSANLLKHMCSFLFVRTLYWNGKEDCIMTPLFEVNKNFLQMI